MTAPINKQPDTGEILFYCDMLALSPAERQAHQALIGRLFGSFLQETRELADGYAYRFDGEHYQLVAEFITHERLCCPFLTFGLTVAPERGPLWLHLTAPGDVKPFLTEELGHYVAGRGVFVVLSLLWGWQLDKTVPDRYDMIGAAVALSGVLIIMYWPRG